jgi:hypothetical protein
VFDIIWQWLKNTYASKAMKHPEKYERWNTIRAACKEMLMAWCVRLRNIHQKPAAIARFSMLLLHHRCSYSIWNILSHMRFALSINTTKQLYLAANAIPLPIRNAWIDHTSIGVIGADNMSYITHSAQVRVENTAMVRYHTLIFILFIMFDIIIDTRG